MSNLQGFGLGMLIAGLVVGGITTLIAVLASKRHGPIFWRMWIPVASLVVFWVAGLGMTIAGIVLLAQPDAHGKHARITAKELRRA